MANLSRRSTTELGFKMADIHPAVRNVNDLSVHIARKHRVTYAELARLDGVGATSISDKHKRILRSMKRPTGLFRVNCALGADYLSELIG